MFCIWMEFIWRRFGGEGRTAKYLYTYPAHWQLPSVSGHCTPIRRQKISQKRFKEVDFNNESFENKWLSRTFDTFNI